MLITTSTSLALYELAAGEASGHAVSAPIEDEPRKHIYRGLELQGLALFEAPRIVPTHLCGSRSSSHARSHARSKTASST